MGKNGQPHSAKVYGARRGRNRRGAACILPLVLHFTSWPLFSTSSKEHVRQFVPWKFEAIFPFI